MKNKAPTKKLLIQAFLFILFPVIGITATYSYLIYLHKVDALKNKVDAQQATAKKNVYELLVVMDKAADLAEDYSNIEMKLASDKLMSQGTAFETELAKGDINKLLHKANIDTSRFELYLIDTTLKVINANNIKELGYELGANNATIKNTFRALMRNQSFIVDRAAYSDIDSTARKYCYQGTKSKKYIYELSIYPERQKEIINSFFAYLTAQSVAPYLSSLSIYYATNRLLSPYKVKAIPAKHIAQVANLRNDTTQLLFKEQNGKEQLTYTYSYLPMQNGVFVNGWILQLVSSDTLKKNLLLDSWSLFLKNIIVFSLFLLLILLLGIKRITTPLATIIDTIDEIKKGDFNKRIRINSTNELGMLANHFNTTIDELAAIHTHLETKVIERTNELQSANTLLLKQHSQKELLLKETHHRVKNNLQIILSLMRLQSSEPTTTASTPLLLGDIESRILTIAAVHDSLYKGNINNSIDANVFVTKLVQDVFYSFNNQQQITYTLAIDSFQVAANNITPLGLLINELLINSFKYAFANETNSEICITLSNKGNGCFYFLYADNGVGFNMIEVKKDSLGLSLIENFVEQLGGKLTKLNVAGTAFEAWLEL